MKENIAGSLVLALGVVIFIIGFEGALGRVLACVFTPGEVIKNG